MPTKRRVRRLIEGRQILLPLCGLIAVAVLSYILIGYIPQKRQAAQDRWHARMDVTAEDRRRHVEAMISDFTADAQTFAEYPTAKALVAATTRRGQPSVASAAAHMNVLLQNAVRGHGLDNAWLFDAAGAEISRGNNDADGQLARRLAMQTVKLGIPKVQHYSARDFRSITYFAAPVTTGGSVTGAVVIAVRTGVGVIPTVTMNWELNRTATVSLVPIDDTFRDAFREYKAPSGAYTWAVTRRVRNAPLGLVILVEREDALRDTTREIGQVLTAVLALLVAMTGLSYALIVRHRAAQLALRHAQYERDVLGTRARALLAANVVGISIGTEDGAVLEANDYYLRLIGYSREDLVEGRIRWKDITPPEHAAADARSIAQLHEHGIAAPYEKEYIRRDGSRVWVLLGDALLRSEENHILTFVIDIDAQKSLELQYQHAQKMEAIGRLAGGVAHDFNNVLTAIKGTASLALDEVQPGDPLHADLQDISDCADRATALTRQLLAFSRRQVLQPKDFDVRDLLDGLNRMLRRLIGEDIDVAVHVAPEPLTVHADPAQIEQVVLNLAVNARDALPNGGSLTINAFIVNAGDVEFECPSVDAPKAYVAIAVSDTGVGMDAVTMTRIFEPFFTTKQQGKGTGLGLATVYGIVKQSAGVIQVASAPGNGTTFTVYLPYKLAKVGNEKRPEGAVPELRAVRKGRILLVEDEDAVRALVLRGLEQKGHHVLEARNAREALTLAESHGAELDLVITDMVMPGLSGTELIERVRVRFPRLEALFMSGYSSEMLEDRKRLQGGHFIEKPFTPKELLDRVNAILSAVVPAGTSR